MIGSRFIHTTYFINFFLIAYHLKFLSLTFVHFQSLHLNKSSKYFDVIIYNMQNISADYVVVKMTLASVCACL